MKNNLHHFFLILFLGAAVFYFFYKNENSFPPMPLPTQGEKYRTDQDESDPDRKEKWIELTHKAAPGTDWREIERQAAKELARTRNHVAPENGSRSVESFANDILKAEWFERGSNNQAGSMRTVEYVPELDKIYGIADGGSLWRGNINGTDWTVLNDDFLLHPEVLESFYPKDSTNVRFIGASGKRIIYSDDEGQTWTDANFSPNFYDGWGSPSNVVILADSLNTIYYLAHTWDATPWAPRSWLYRSTDGGVNFERVRIFNEEEKHRISLWSPYQSEEVYVQEGGLSIHYFNADTSFTLLSNGLENNGDIGLTGFKKDSFLVMYALENDNQVYKSYNGADWIFQGELPTNAWGVGMACSPFDSLKLFSGAVDCHLSYDGGITWELANAWWEYYDQLNLLHADIMDLKFFEKTDSTQFFLIANHGGLHVSYDHLDTSFNIGLEGMNISQYYDVVTNQNDPKFMYVGSQDQGWQWTTAGDEKTPADFVQQWSGDYGQMLLTRNYQSFWTQYPGGIMDYYHYATSPITPWPDSEFNVDGEDMPAVNWIIPTANMEAFPNQNTVFVAGGNITGGPGSYLIMLTASTFAPFEIVPNQLDFDFKANSNTGNGLISAIEQSPFFDGERIYVTTSDGTFFRTNDFGATWEKSQGFSGPGADWLYTSCILASKIDPETVYISGSGYSNPPVYRSVDGGMTFEPISQGLPGTVVQEMVANDDETLLFAATTLGPFVYVTWEDHWHPLLGESTPLQWYTSVEYIASENIVRFGTFGRGVWDLEIVEVEEPPVAVAENDQNINVEIFPNPVATNGMINIETNSSGQLEFILSNVAGKIVKKELINGRKQINVGRQPTGTYFYSFAKNGKLVNNGKLVIL